MRQDQIQIRPLSPADLPTRPAIPPASGAPDPREIRETVVRDASSLRASNSSIGSNPALARELRAHVVVHRREARGIAHAFERFEIQLGEVDAIPIESARSTPSRPPTPRGSSRDSSRFISLRQSSLRVLQHRRLLAPLGMVVPELLAHVRQFQPCVDQDALRDGRLRSALADIRSRSGSGS